MAGAPSSPPPLDPAFRAAGPLDRRPRPSGRRRGAAGRPWAPLTWLSVIVAALFLIPVVSVLFSLTQSGDGTWAHLASTVLPRYLFNTAVLVGGVGIGVPVLGAIRQDKTLVLPSRHLGLVQATEHERLESFITDAAFAVTIGVDLDRIAALTAVQGEEAVTAAVPRLSPIGQRIAVAKDAAFGFTYAHVLQGWKRHGAELSFFSPLEDEAPAGDADAVYLPGGYPELHAGRLAMASTFMEGLRAAAAAGKRIYGECGGYMVLGEGLVDADGTRHEMAGLLPLVTSYAKQRRHLGYRRLMPLPASPWHVPLTAHEFHYSTLVSEGEAERLFSLTDARGAPHGEAGLRRGSVCGSYMHVIDRAD